MLIYLKGISSAELEHVTDFIYNGEASITQDELKKFLETAQDLQVKGLQGDLQGICKNVFEEQNMSDQGTTQGGEKNIEFEEEDFVVSQESIHDSLEELAVSFDTSDGTLVKMDENDHELDLQIEKMI